MTIFSTLPRVLSIEWSKKVEEGLTQTFVLYA